MMTMGWQQPHSVLKLGPSMAASEAEEEEGSSIWVVEDDTDMGELVNTGSSW